VANNQEESQSSSIQDVLDKYDGDVYIYLGEISRSGYKQLSQSLEGKHNKKKRACLILVTYGGDPDAGYRISRAMNHYYDKFEILIPDVCKSAGTLICIGASKLIFGDRGELGPLDIQLSKPDELFENMSGLDIIQAVSALEDRVLTTFKKCLIDMRRGAGLRTKMAADIAVKLADGFIAPITARIDPVTLGEHQRAMQIAYDYGERLNKMSGSMKGGALVNLVSSYPSHGFVIDRKEAGELFNDISSPDGETNDLYVLVRGVIEQYPPQASMLVGEIGPMFASNNQANEDNDDEDINEQSENYNEASNGSHGPNESNPEPESSGDEPDAKQPIQEKHTA